MIGTLWLALSIAAPGTTGIAPKPQVTASFSSQGAEALRAMTGKRIKGVGLTSVTVCSANSARIPVGYVFQAAIEHGISPIDPDIAVGLINRKVGFSLFNILPDVVSDGAGGMALIINLLEGN